MSEFSMPPRGRVTHPELPADTHDRTCVPAPGLVQQKSGGSASDAPIARQTTYQLGANSRGGQQTGRVESALFRQAPAVVAPAAAAVAALLALAGGSGCEAGPTNGPVQIIPPADAASTEDADAPAAPPAAFTPTFAVAELFDLEALRDPSAVEVVAGDNVLVPHDELTWTSAFAFRSQVWHASPWDHSTVAYLPSKPRTDSGGLWVIMHSDAIDLESELAVESKFGRLLAERVGVPVLVLGDLPSPTIMRESESPTLAESYPECFEHLLGVPQLFACTTPLTRSSGDLQWDVLLPMVRTYVRAMTVAAALRVRVVQLDESLAALPEPKRFVLLGGGERGLAAWLAAAVDDRVAGVWVAASDTLDLEDLWERTGHDWSDHAAEAVDWLGFFEEGFGRHWRTLHDPGAWMEALGDRPVVIARGTNDALPLRPLASRSAYSGKDRLEVADLSARLFPAWAPNFGHGFAAAPLDVAWRGFVAAIADRREPPLASLDVVQAGNDWAATVHWSGADADACTLWHATPAAGASTERDFRGTTWEPVAVTASGAAGSAAAQFPAQGGSAAAIVACQGTAPADGSEAPIWYSDVWTSW